MKPGIILTIGMVLLKAIPIHAQTNSNYKPMIADSTLSAATRPEKKRMNFFVISTKEIPGSSNKVQYSSRQN